MSSLSIPMVSSTWQCFDINLHSVADALVVLHALASTHAPVSKAARLCHGCAELRGVKQQSHRAFSAARRQMTVGSQSFSTMLLPCKTKHFTGYGKVIVHNREQEQGLHACHIVRCEHLCANS